MLSAATRSRLLSTHRWVPIAPRWSRPPERKNAHRGLAGSCRAASRPTRSQVSIASGENSRCCTKARRTPLLPQGNRPPEVPCSGPSCTQTVRGSPPPIDWWFPGNPYYGPPYLSRYPGGPVSGRLPFIPGLCYASISNNSHAGRNILATAVAGAGVAGYIYTGIAIVNLEDGGGELMLALRAAQAASNSEATIFAVSR